MLATPAGRRRALLYGWAWLFAVGELLVGGEARRLETSADYETSSSLSRNETSVVGLAVLGAARASHGDAVQKGARAHAANTTARAADAADNATAGAAATTGADGDDGGGGDDAAGATGDAPLYVLTAAFNSMCYNASSCAEAGVGHKEVELVIRLGDYFASGAGGDDDDVIAVEQYYIDSSNALYDTIWRDLAARGELKKHDPYVYDLNQMSSTAGKEYVEAAFDDVYAPMQRELLAPRAFAGGALANGTHLVLTFEHAAPSVSLLAITRGPSAASDAASRAGARNASDAVPSR